MAKTSRTRNTKELICQGEPVRTSEDQVMRTAVCDTCGVRHVLHADRTLVRHVPPPPVLKQQTWSVVKGRYLD